MTDAIIVEGLGKAYRLGPVSSAAEVAKESLVEAVLRPFRRRLRSPAGDDLFWALKDVSFSLPVGQSLGIVGRNGSGKSTLLKLLTGVTEPTEGRAMIRGRVGSLLEVGTGFHPDLSGRENIFLNGSVLGISRANIMAAFDRIVEFADIGPFIDNPVKFYSSGMFVRLAFSVAVHLRTDILILDEVMAVGDAEFQKKCIDAMERLIHDGRTVLFVSHSSAAVLQFCSLGMLLDHGRCLHFGEAGAAMTKYLQMIHHIPMDDSDGQEEILPTMQDLRDLPRWDGAKAHILTSISMTTSDGTPTSHFQAGDSMVVEIAYETEDEIDAYCMLNVVDMQGTRVMSLHSSHDHLRQVIGGRGVFVCVIPDLRLMAGEYMLMPDLGVYEKGDRPQWIDSVPNALRFRIRLGDYLGGVGLLRGQGMFAQRTKWSIRQGGDGTIAAAP